QRRSSNANSLQSRNSAGFPQIRAIFQRDNLRRHFFAVRLRYVPPARGQCPIGAPMDARVQISEVSVKVCRVALPCHAVDTWSGALLQFEEHSPQDVDRDVVQERCELLLFVPGDSSTYAVLRL